MFVSLSPFYAVRNENNCSYVVRLNGIRTSDAGNFGMFEIPPFIGYILANIHKYPEEEAYVEISRVLKTKPDSIKKFVSQLIDNSKPRRFDYSDTISINFPINMLRRSDESPEIECHTEEDFDPLSEFRIKRPSFPLVANLMITTACSTDCLYCYADRSLRPVLSFQQVERVVRQLREGGCVNLSLTGGDIFVRKDFLKVLDLVSKLGFHQFLSTKTPLDSDSLKRIKEMGYDNFQFSLDSCNPETLKTHLRTDSGYIERVGKMLDECGKLGIKVTIRTVLTSVNGSKEEMENLYKFICGYECVCAWDVTPYMFSPYKADTYDEYRVGNDILKYMYGFSKKEGLEIPISLNKINKEGYVLQKHETTCEFVCENMICVGNCYCISILANGKCTVCEMLYEHPDFLLGDASVDSIKSIWNSEKALGIYSPKQEDAPADSPCAKCGEFNACRCGTGKRVCYSDIVKTGGGLYSPDPHCPLADPVEVLL